MSGASLAEGDDLGNDCMQTALEKTRRPSALGFDRGRGVNSSLPAQPRRNASLPGSGKLGSRSSGCNFLLSDSSLCIVLRLYLPCETSKSYCCYVLRRPSERPE